MLNMSVRNEFYLGGVTVGIKVQKAHFSPPWQDLSSVISVIVVNESWSGTQGTLQAALYILFDFFCYQMYFLNLFINFKALLLTFEEEIQEIPLICQQSNKMG